MADIKILQPCKTAMSSGRAKTKKWIIQFDESSEKYREYLMGWTGTFDNRYQMNLHFSSKEEAINFADKHNFSYTIEEPKASRFVPKSYAENFTPYRVKG